MSALLVLVLLGAVAGGIYFYLETQATKDVKMTTLPAGQIIRQAVQEIGGRRRWMASGHSSDFASFTYKRHANCLVGLLLACLGLIPGIVYMIIGSRTESLTLNVFPEADGTSSVQVSASGRRARSRGITFLRALPAPAVSAIVEVTDDGVPPPPPPVAELPPPDLGGDARTVEAVVPEEDEGARPS